MKKRSLRSVLLGGGALVTFALGLAVLVSVPSSETRSNTPAQAQPAAVPVRLPEALPVRSSLPIPLRTGDRA